MRQDMLGLVLLIWALGIAGYDFWRLRVLNWSLIVVAVPAILAQVFNGRGLLGQDTIGSLTGAGIGFGVLIIGYAVGKVAAGDVKYATVLGFLVGMRGIASILLFTAIVLGMMSLAALGEAYLRQREARKIPAAVALSAGFAAYLIGM